MKKFNDSYGDKKHKERGKGKGNLEKKIQNEKSQSYNHGLSFSCFHLFPFQRGFHNAKF